MANTKIANSEAISACDAVVDALDGGTGAGVIKIYGDTQPSGGPDAGDGGATLLAELTLSDPAFGSASDATPGGEATANAISDDTSANATGTATWFRAETSDGTAVIDGDAGDSGSEDLVLDSASISSGATVSITSWTVTMPEG